MSADTTRVILITDGDQGPEYRFAVAQAWQHLAWLSDDEGEVLNDGYVASVFERSPVVTTTIEDARHALTAHIEEKGYVVEYDEQILDLSAASPTNLERHLGIIPSFPFSELVARAAQALESVPR